MPRSRAFAQPLLFTQEHVVTLLTASPNHALGVDAGAGALQIWGLLDGDPFLRPRIRIAGTGSLVASQGRRLLALLRSGEVHIPASHEAAALMLVSRALGEKKPFPAQAHIASRFLQVVTAIRGQGHGGALVVVPPGFDMANGIEVPFLLGESSTTTMEKALQGWLDAEQKVNDFQTSMRASTDEIALWIQTAASYRGALESTVHAVGNLGAVDGAVVMDEGLRLLGFGAKLAGQQGSFALGQFDMIGGTLSETRVENLGGTRHQSAARFVRAHNDVMVFVASQDGRITLFIWVASPGQVLAIRGMEYFAGGN